MKRKLFCEISPFTYRLSMEKEIRRRSTGWTGLWLPVPAPRKNGHTGIRRYTILQAGDDAEYLGGQDEGGVSAPARQSHKNIRGREYFSIFLVPLDAKERPLLLDIIEDRHGRKSTIITSQLPVSNWYDAVGDPTVADALLDRIVHTAHRIELTGESMRKIKSSKLK